MNIPNTGIRMMNIIHPLEPVSLNLLTVALIRGSSPNRQTIPHTDKSKFSPIWKLFTQHAVNIGKPKKNKA